MVTPRPPTTLFTFVIGQTYWTYGDIVTQLNYSTPGVTKKFSLFSRIDFLLISKDMKRQVTEVKMCPDTMTDHKTTFLKLNLSEDNKIMFNHWKCNSSLLCNREFTEVVKKTLSFSIGNLQFLIILIMIWGNIGNYFNTKSENVQFNLVKIWLKRKKIKLRI